MACENGRLPTTVNTPRPTFRNDPGVAVARHFDQGCGSGMRGSGVVQDRRHWPPTNDVSWRGQFCMHSIQATDQPYSTCDRHLDHDLAAVLSGFLYSTRKERRELAADSTARLVQLHGRLVLGHEGQSMTCPGAEICRWASLALKRVPSHRSQYSSMRPNILHYLPIGSDSTLCRHGDDSIYQWHSPEQHGEQAFQSWPCHQASLLHSHGCFLPLCHHPSHSLSCPRHVCPAT